MGANVSTILKEISLNNGVDIDYTIHKVSIILKLLHIPVKRNIFDLGRVGNSYMYIANSDYYGILLDPISIIEANKRTGYKEALCYEIAHEMTHPSVSLGLKWFQKAALNLDSFFKSGVKPDAFIIASVKDAIENIEIDRHLIRNPILRRGFYYKQADEHFRTWEYLNTSDCDKTNAIIHFLSICRRAMVAKHDMDTNTLHPEYYVFNVRFRNQIDKFFTKCPSKKFIGAWQHIKQSDKISSFQVNKLLVEYLSESVL